MSTKKSNRIRNRVFLAVVLVLLVAAVGFTYSRYASSATANANANIANWSIKLNENDISSESKNIDVTARTVEGISNANVADGKIAPGQTLVATIEADPNGSEVAVDYLLTASNITTDGFDNSSEIKISKVLATVGDADTSSEAIFLNDEYIFYENLTDVLAGKKVKFDIYFTWDDVDNTADTSNGSNALQIVVPMQVTARQHLASDGFVSVLPIDTVTLLEAAVDTLSAGDTLAFSKSVNYEGNYPANAYHQVEFPENFTLDLNGKELASTNGSVLFAEDGLTIKNGTLRGIADSYGRTYTCIWDYAGETPVKNMVIENVIADGGLNLYNHDNLVLRNVTSTATKYYSVFCNESVTLSIIGGTYSTTAQSTALFGYLGEYKGQQTNPADGFKIYSGTFITNGKPFCLTGGTEQVYIPPVIYGGTFDCDVTDYVADGHTITKTGETTWVVE